TSHRRGVVLQPLVRPRLIAPGAALLTTLLLGRTLPSDTPGAAPALLLPPRPAGSHQGAEGGMVAARPAAASLTAPAVVDYSGLTSGTRGHIPPDATPPYSSVSRGPPARSRASGRRLCASPWSGHAASRPATAASKPSSKRRACASSSAVTRSPSTAAAITSATSGRSIAACAWSGCRRSGT